MARRSPNNARYQKFQEPPGKTRKSAAAAKPVRKEGSGTPSSASSKSKSASKSSAQRLPYDPPTPEFKLLRTWWWSLLGAGVVLVLISWATRQYTHFAAKTVVASLTLGLAYFSIAVAFYLDFAKMRPLRKEYQASHGKPATK